MLHRLRARAELRGEQPGTQHAVSLLPLFLLIVPLGGQALHRVALHIQDALELLRLPLIRQREGLLREHCRDGRRGGSGPAQARPLPPGQGLQSQGDVSCTAGLPLPCPSPSPDSLLKLHSRDLCVLIPALPSCCCGNWAKVLPLSESQFPHLFCGPMVTGALV